MLPHFASLFLMLEEELALFEAERLHIRELTRLPAHARSKTLLAVQTALETSPLLQISALSPSSNPARTEMIGHLLLTTAARAVETALKEAVAEVMAVVSAALERRHIRLYPYLVMVDYLIRAELSANTVVSAPSLVLAAHWSAASKQNPSGSVLERHTALLEAAFGISGLVARVMALPLPQQVASLEDLRHSILKATHTLLHQYFHTGLPECEAAVDHLIQYWFDDLKLTLSAAVTAALYQPTGEPTLS